MSDISYSSIEDQSYEDFSTSSTPNLAITHSSSVNHGTSSDATTTPCSMEVDSSDGLPTIANICGSTGSNAAGGHVVIGGAGRGRRSSGSAGGLVMMADHSSGSDCETECEPALQIDLNPGAGHGGADRKSNRLECDKD